jgi:hypothetical protein
VQLHSVAHSVGMAPGKDEKRVVFDLYNYIQPRPTGFFDGFHLISAEIKYSIGIHTHQSQIASLATSIAVFAIRKIPERSPAFNGKYSAGSLIQ